MSIRISGIILVKLYVFNYSPVCLIDSLECLAIRIFAIIKSFKSLPFWLKKTPDDILTWSYYLGETAWLSESRQFLSVPWLHSQVGRVLGNPPWC